MTTRPAVATTTMSPTPAATGADWPAPAVRHVREIARWVQSAPMRLRAALAEQRGDVPGWVLVTLMTAGLVLAIYGIASPALQGVFNRAIESVSGVK